MSSENRTASLRRRLREAEETLAAIRTGEVDAVVVESATGQKIYTLESPDQPFWIFVEWMQEGALTLSHDGTVVYCNPYFAELIGTPVEHVRGRLLSEMVADDHRAQLHSLLELARRGIVHGDCRLQTADGWGVPVQLAFNPLPAEDVRMYGVVVTDLTERERVKLLEAERRAAEEANAARDQFLAVVSHELRTPLNAVVGWAQMLQRRADLPAPVQRGLDVIERNAWAQVQLIDDLLDVSRILAGKLRLELKSVNLVAVVEAAVASIQPSAEARHIHLVTQLPSQPLRTRGDADRLQQVVWNLLSNAVKFSPEGGQVDVRLQERDGVAEVRVIDRGVGIPRDFLPRLFELYQQMERSASRSAGGLGLGLAIVKQLTELHGGRVSADSPGEGHGAEFAVQLPLLASAEAEGEAEARPQPTAQALRGLRLLLVEDEQDAREMLTEVLEGLGGAVTPVTSAEAALSVLEREPFDILISDINLPGTDGYELIRRIRAAGRSGRDLPAIAVTAFASRADRRQALLSGYQMHASKPLDQDELAAMIQSLAGPGRN